MKSKISHFTQYIVAGTSICLTNLRFVTNHANVLSFKTARNCLSQQRKSDFSAHAAVISVMRKIASHSVCNMIIRSIDRYDIDHIYPST